MDQQRGCPPGLAHPASPAFAPPAQILRLTGPRGRITRLHWSDQNRVLLSSSEDGMVRRWDVETGKCLAEKQLHEKQVGQPSGHAGRGGGAGGGDTWPS